MTPLSNTSNQTFSSTPACSQNARHSANRAACPPIMICSAIFASVAFLHSGPINQDCFPMRRKSTRHFSYAARRPAAKINNAPSFASFSPPDTGAAKYSARWSFSITRLIVSDVSASIVDISTYTTTASLVVVVFKDPPSFCFCSLSPSANCSATIFDAVGSASIAYTISHPLLAISFGDVATDAPFSFRVSAFDAVRFHTDSASFVSSRFIANASRRTDAMPFPIVPRPRNPIFRPPFPRTIIEGDAAISSSSFRAFMSRDVLRFFLPIRNV
mmetsp:Transcript_11049/g.31288  ORF Transcript_11049/g.31288 Transcript_11049/m.31288 type:complete len:273 (-) Transcript_11049:45-863(-)